MEDCRQCISVGPWAHCIDRNYYCLVLKLIELQAFFPSRPTPGPSLKKKNFDLICDSHHENFMYLLRSSRDEYATVIGRCLIHPDPYPQWRRVVWSPEVDMLAYSDSSGNVNIFDLLGTVVCYIPSVSRLILKLCITT